jgi:hypothetical protein
MENHDLYSKQWPIEDIEANIDRLSLKTILYTQTITAEFAVKYILTTDDYACCVEETYYDINDVLDLQPHLTREEILCVARRLYAEKHHEIGTKTSNPE